MIRVAMIHLMVRRLARIGPSWTRSEKGADQDYQAAHHALYASVDGWTCCRYESFYVHILTQRVR